MDVRVGPQRRLNAKKLMLLNGGVGEVLRVPCTVKRSNLSILKEISPEYSWEGMNDNPEEMNDAETETLILWSPDSLKKTLMLGMIEGRRRTG